jgi:hypothetical protein
MSQRTLIRDVLLRHSQRWHETGDPKHLKDLLIAQWVVTAFNGGFKLTERSKNGYLDLRAHGTASGSRVA